MHCTCALFAALGERSHNAGLCWQAGYRSCFMGRTLQHQAKTCRPQPDSAAHGRASRPQSPQQPQRKTPGTPPGGCAFLGLRLVVRAGTIQSRLVRNQSLFRWSVNKGVGVCFQALLATKHPLRKISAVDSAWYNSQLWAASMLYRASYFGRTPSVPLVCC